MQLKPDTLLQGGKYRIVRSLGQGGFGITYEAEQVLLRRKVAVKEFFMKDCCERDDATSRVTIGTGNQRALAETFRGKFIREAQMIAGMDHPHIVRVLDVFEENGTAYYVMDFLPGGSLADKVKKDGPLSEAKAEEYIRQVADALDYIHGQNTVHLDVKPSNILLNAKGEAILIDFGISKHYDDSGDQTSSTPVGISKGYAPLEQSRDGDVSQFKPSTDIYALGATLYYLITGVVPPEASIVNEDGLIMPQSVSGRIWGTIEKSMQPRRKDRFQSIDEFLSCLAFSNLSVDSSESSDQDDATIVCSPLSSNSSNCIENDAIEHRTPISNKNNRFSASIIASILVGVIMLIGSIVLFKNCHNDNLEKTSTISTLPIHQIDSILIDGRTQNSITFSPIKGQQDFQLHKNFNEEVAFSYNNNDSWCSIVVLNDKVTVVCSENTTVSDRVQEVKFMKIGDSTVLASIVVTQKAAEQEKPSLPHWLEESVSGNARGHDYVDLGLSVFWATCNLGAKLPSDYGGFYAFGETRTKKMNEYDSEHYKFYDPTSVRFSRYDDYGPDPAKKLYIEDDAARVNWGGSWRIPTQKEQQELVEQCKWVWVSVNGHFGYKVTGPTGKSIFLPASGIAGYSNSRYADRGNRGYYHASDAPVGKYGGLYCLFFDHSMGEIGIDHILPIIYMGRSVRPVMK